MRKREHPENQASGSLLSDITFKKNPFKVPEAYFPTLERSILFKKKLMQTSDSSFQVPKAYQDSLTESILIRVKEEELRKNIPSGEMPLPEAYFDDLEKRILSRTIQLEEEIPVKRLFIKRWLPYSAAAAVLAMVLALFFLFEDATIQNRIATDTSLPIESIATEEIINYLAFYSEAGDLQHLSTQLPGQPEGFTEGLSSQEVQAYLEYGL